MISFGRNKRNEELRRYRYRVWPGREGYWNWEVEGGLVFSYGFGSARSREGAVEAALEAIQEDKETLSECEGRLQRQDAAVWHTVE